MARRSASFQELFLQTLGQVGPTAMEAGKLIGDTNRASAESKARLGLLGEQTRVAKTEADGKTIDYDRELRKSSLEKSMVGGLDAHKADPLYADAALASMTLGRTVTPDELRKEKGRKEKSADLDVQDKEFTVGEKKAKATRDAEAHTSSMETDKVQRSLYQAQAGKVTADAGATSTKPPTESQSNSATFGRRLEQAIADMDEIKKGGYDASSKTAGLGRTLAKTPGVGNMMASEGLQRQRNAETNFLTAVLRKESGASISPTEFSTGEQLYFERAGDSEAVKAQKARNRQQALEGLKAGAGAAWETVAPVARPEAAKTNFTDLSDDDLDAQLRAKGIDPATGKRISRGGASGSF